MSEHTPVAQTDATIGCCRTCADWLWRPDVARTAHGPLSVCINTTDGDYRCPRWRVVEVIRNA